MPSESTTGWVVELTTSNLTENSTAPGNRTLTVGGEANAILAEETIKIIYLVIGEFTTQRKVK